MNPRTASMLASGALVQSSLGLLMPDCQKPLSDATTALGAIAKFVARRLARLYRDSRELNDAVIAVQADVYLQLEAGAALNSALELALDEVRRVERREQRERRHTIPLSGLESSSLIGEKSAEEQRSGRIALDEWTREALSHLSAAQRIVLEGYLDGLSDADLGVILECSNANVRQLRSRAFCRVRTLVTQGTLSPPPSRD